VIEEGREILKKRQAYISESLDYAAFARDAIAEYIEMADEREVGSPERGMLLAEAQMLRNRSRERVRKGRMAMASMRDELHDLVTAMYVMFENVDEARAQQAQEAVDEMEDVLAEWFPENVSSAWNVF